MTNNKIEKFADWLYSEIMEKPLHILEIFNDYFGEARVELQGYSTKDEIKSYLNEAKIDNFITSNNPSYTLNQLSLDDAEIVIERIKNNPENIIRIIAHNIFILVYFKEVTITNEFNQSTIIQDLWVKIPITAYGTLRDSAIYLNRSTYSVEQFVSNYMHSHVSNIPTQNFTEFQRPCFGTGPICNTLEHLFETYNEDIWKLLCLEIEKYIATESVSGIPYHRMETIGFNSSNYTYADYVVNFYPVSGLSDTYKTMIFDFIKYFIELKALKFNYSKGNFSIGIPFIDFMILISNKFIDWYNNSKFKDLENCSIARLKGTMIIDEGIISNGRLYIERAGNNDIRAKYNQCKRYIGKEVCTFKGKKITLNIFNVETLLSKKYSTFLNPGLVLYILYKIFEVLNFTYKKNYDYYDNTSKSFNKSDIIFL